jgi:alkanesulfonate monooxygenase SsuD/methylene tetrahydromethanopterin reductase-like flavin-dependent oxidoreductase (luciferase family)
VNIMDIGIGLPNTLHTSGPAIIDWARRAEERGWIPVLIGGTGDATVRRVVQYGEGWTAGGGGPEAAAPVVAKVRKAWQEAEVDRLADAVL